MKANKYFIIIIFIASFIISCTGKYSDKLEINSMYANWFWAERYRELLSGKSYASHFEDTLYFDNTEQINEATIITKYVEPRYPTSHTILSYKDGDILRMYEKWLEEHTTEFVYEPDGRLSAALSAGSNRRYVYPTTFTRQTYYNDVLQVSETIDFLKTGYSMSQDDETSIYQTQFEFRFKKNKLIYVSKTHTGMKEKMIWNLKYDKNGYILKIIEAVDGVDLRQVGTVISRQANLITEVHVTTFEANDVERTVKLLFSDYDEYDNWLKLQVYRGETLVRETSRSIMYGHL